MKSNRKKRVLFIVPLPPPIHGSAMMSQYIRESALINLCFDCDYINLSTSRRMDEIGQMSWRKIFRFLSSFLTLLYKLTTHHYDLCYLSIKCHGKGFLKDAPFIFLCKLLGRKIAFHQHNKGLCSAMAHMPHKKLLPMAYRDARVIILSQRLFSDLDCLVKEEDTLVCPNGIPDCGISVLQEKCEGRVHILFLSNLLRSKGIIHLLDACKILKEMNTQFVCDIVGSETPELNSSCFEKEIAIRGLKNYVIYHGRMVGEAKEKILDESNIFVFPTMDDCFPLVLLEAMQHSLPIITTEVGGIPDIVEDRENGYIISELTPTSLADKMRILISNATLRQAMGERSYARYRSQFTLECFEYRLKDCLEKIMS